MSDATSWAEEADWIGVHATPFASMRIDGLDPIDPATDIEPFLLDWSVPLRGGARLVKAINWPQFLIGDGISLLPEMSVDDLRRFIVALLKQHSMLPLGEGKSFQTIEFFNYCVARAEQRKRGGGLAG